MITFLSKSKTAFSLLEQQGEMLYHGRQAPELCNVRKDSLDPHGVMEIDTKDHTLVVMINHGQINAHQDDDVQALGTGCVTILPPGEQCRLENGPTISHLTFVWLS